MKKSSEYISASMDKKTLAFIVLFLIITLIMLCIDEYWIVDSVNGPSFAAEKSIVINLLSTCASACGLSAAWEIVCKRSFAKEILTLNKMSDSCYEGGIEYIYKDYNNVDWYEELNNITEFTILFCYGYTWRNHNRTLLRDFLNKGGKFTVLMPDYSCDELMDELDRRFGFGQYSASGTQASTRERIKEACVDFTQMGASIKFFRRTLCALYYFMDDKAIYVPFRHCEERITYPAIRVNNHGTIYKFIEEDLKNLHVYDSPKNQIE